MEILGGPIFAVAGAGESHGPGVTTIVFGCPAGTSISRAQIQHYLDRRRPGGNKHGTPRNEPDRVVLLSGIYQENLNELLAGPQLSIATGQLSEQSESYETGHATGEPIAAIVLSTSQKSGDYARLAAPSARFVQVIPIWSSSISLEVMPIREAAVGQVIVQRSVT